MLTTTLILLTVAFTVGVTSARPPTLEGVHAPNNNREYENIPIVDLMREDTYVLSYAEYENTWEEFKRTYNKTYKNADEEGKRFGIFMENVKFIEHHNWKYHNQRSTFYLGLNHFADLTNKEYRRFIGLRDAPKGHCDPYKPATKDVPASVDWREKGYVTPVKKQGGCGSCWTFSATGAIEGQWFKAKGKLLSLSEQQILDCTTVMGEQSCDGGWMDAAFDYVMSAGLETEAEYPYVDKNEACVYNKSEARVRISSCADVLPRQDENALKVAVGNMGPVSVAVDASSDSFQYYAGGVYDNSDCMNTLNFLDHGVLVVGYGTVDSHDYWLVKNSWTTSWGVKGYILMSRNRNNQCGIATWASFPVV